MIRRADFAGYRRESDFSVGQILVWNMQGHAAENSEERETRSFVSGWRHQNELASD
jgi:signal transduction histidine kinase